MKTLLAGALIASTIALAVPAPASAIGVFVGPRGGVGVRLGGLGYRGGYGYRRGFGYGGYGYRRGFYGRRVYRRF